MRYILVNKGSQVVAKQTFADADTTADGLLARTFLSIPSYSIQEVDQTAFNAATEVADFSSVQTTSINTLLTEPGTTRTLLRVILLVILDEINVLRTALSLAPRTVTQLKTAIQTKASSSVAG